MSAMYENREIANAAAEKLKVFAQPQRLMILSCLLRAERTVSEISDITGIAQPALSQQLAELRRAELVRTRKEVKQVWYTLADVDVVFCVQTMESIFAGSTPSVPSPVPSPSALESTVTQQVSTSERHGVAQFARVL